MTQIDTDICIIGGGSGGLTVAAGAAQMGAKVVLIEGGKLGGDCLNYGCVPSKSLIAAAHAAHGVRHGGRFGVNGHEPDVDFLKVRDHVREVIAHIGEHDSRERFEGFGVKVIEARGRFTGPREVEAGDHRIKARRFVIATGSSAAVPPIPGLDTVPYLTNETIFDLDERPEHLLVIGGGPIGAELAQAHRRLGAEVTIVDAGPVMAKDDPELAGIVARNLSTEGIAIHAEAKILKISVEGNQIAMDIEHEGSTLQLLGSHLLVAAGRRANVKDLGLETAGIESSPRGIEVDRRLRTSNRRVFAIGDVAGSYQFTHMAGYHGGIVIRNALFGIPARIDDRAVPWVTYTDPELAHVGLSETEARARDKNVKVLREYFQNNDRAQAERAAEGLIKVIVGRKGAILGASIVGPHAGELIAPWALAISSGLKIGAMTKLILPYPTLSELSKRVAGSYYTPTLFGPKTRRVVRAVQTLLP